MPTVITDFTHNSCCSIVNSFVCSINTSLSIDDEKQRQYVNSDQVI